MYYCKQNIIMRHSTIFHYFCGKLSNMKNYYKILLFCLSALLLLSGCSPKKSDTLGATLAEFRDRDTVFIPTGNAELDSLLQLAAVAPVDTNLAKLYSDIGYLYSNFDYEKAKEYLLKLKSLSEMLNWNKGYYLFAFDYTNVINAEGLTDSSIVILKKALDLAKAEGNEDQAAKALANIGNCYNFKEWFETALSYYNEALTYFEKREDKIKMAYIYNLIGLIYDRLEATDKQYEYIKKAVTIFKDEPDDIQKAHVFLNYAVALNTKFELAEAEKYLLEAQRILLIHNARYLLIALTLNLGDNAMRKNDWTALERYSKQSLEYALEFGNVAGYCIANRALAYSELFGKQNFIKSENYVKEALETAGEYNLPIELLKCFYTISQIYSAKHDFTNARLYEIKIDSLSRSIRSDLVVRTINEMEVKYETEKKQLEIEKQKITIAKQTQQRYFFVGGIAVLAIILALLWILLRQRNHRNQILAETNAVKDKFFSIISHDLKNPALVQRDAIQLLKKNVTVWETEILSQYCNELSKSAELHVELLYNLLNWAQVQTGRMVFQPTTFDLVAGLNTEITLASEMAQHKNIEFITQLPEDAIVSADRNMIATVVRNLLTNAVKFTPSGGQVTLEITAGTGVARNAPTRISISDTGIGMTEEQIRHLIRKNDVRADFKSAPTKSAPTPGTANETGSGLGLIVCKEMLEKHGSVLHIESEEGKGSTFWFEL